MAQCFAGVAQEDFERAKSKARISRILSFFTKKNDDLPTFEQIKEIAKPKGESYAGCKTILVDRILGSEGRSKDFNKNFMPRKGFMRNRWVRVATAFYEDKILPPIKVLDLGGMYFIRDGNHRVSVARAQKVAYIDAEITKLNSDFALDPTISIDELIKNAAA